MSFVGFSVSIVSMKKIVLIPLLLLLALVLRAQGDPRSLQLMGVALEGPVDSVSQQLLTREWVQWGQSADGEDYYFRGKYYGLRAKLLVTIKPDTQLVTSAYVTIGPYSTEKMLQHNLQYFKNKLTAEYGSLTSYDDAWVYMDNYGSIKLSVVDNDNGSHDIRVLYVIEGAYYKDALTMGLRGPVQEVVTENAVSEVPFMHFSQDGQIENPDLQERQYDSYGYLVSGRMTEKEGYSLVTCEYDEQRRLVKRIQQNPVAGITYTHEYTYTDDGDVLTERQKVFEKDDCVLTINLLNSYLTRDDQGNWTSNQLQLTYWEKGSQSQKTNVMQKRTIAYWGE